MTAIRIALNVGSFVLVAILGWFIVRIGLGLFQPKSLYAPDPIVAPAQRVATGANPVTYDFSTDPFAFGEVAAATPVEVVDDAPETTLNLKLIGIVSESNATFRLADGKNKAVKIENEVMNGVTLTGTAKDFVTLDVNGETQKLTLERVKLGEKETSAKISRAAPANTASGSASGSDSGADVPTQAEVEKLFSQVQLTPHRELLPNRKMRMKGFKIQAQSGADLSKFNLKSGDILTRVGPVMLNSRQVNIKELRDLLATGAAQDYEVIRDGAPVTIRIGQ